MRDRLRHWAWVHLDTDSELMYRIALRVYQWAIR